MSFSFVGMNTRQGVLADRRIRRAVAHAIRRNRLVALDPQGRIRATGILPPGMFGYSPEPKTLPYDPDIARSLLAEAGYPDGQGLPPLVAINGPGGELNRRSDAILREDLAEVGIQLHHEYVDWAEFNRRLLSHEITTFRIVWVADVPDPDSFLAALFASDGAFDLFDYANDTVDSLLTVGAEMRSSVDRAAVYRRAEKLILEDAVVIPLFHNANNFAVRQELHGLVVTPFGLGNLPLERVWFATPES
jgi:ABC-type transport system substrate-binding protein